MTQLMTEKESAEMEAARKISNIKKIAKLLANLAVNNEAEVAGMIMAKMDREELLHITGYLLQEFSPKEHAPQINMEKDNG